MKKSWQVWHAPEGCEFVTSDCPMHLLVRPLSHSARGDLASRLWIWDKKRRDRVSTGSDSVPRNDGYAVP